VSTRTETVSEKPRAAKLGRNPFEARATQAPRSERKSSETREEAREPRGQTPLSARVTVIRLAQGAFYWTLGAALECVALRLSTRTLSR
jgi:hypothetical protein